MSHKRSVSYTKKRSFSGFSGAALKWIALVTMLIDHIALALLAGGLLPEISGAVLAGFSTEYIVSDYRLWYNIYSVMRLIGRIAFPIYCFLLVEGFLHTNNVKKYALRLGIFALLSEVPFDLAAYNKPFDWQLQNVFFTLFLGLLAMIAIRHIELKAPNYGFFTYVIMFVAMLLAYLLRSDYGAFGIFLILLLYLLRESKLLRHIAGAVSVIWEYTAPIAFIFTYFYNGSRGKQPSRYFFYLFYPVHLLLLYFLRILIF